MTRALYLSAAVALCTLAIAPGEAHAQVPIVHGTLPFRWESGGPDCSVVKEDFQIHRYNDDFYILRQSGCVHFEKPFLYLIFGRDKVILFDTGAGPDVDPTTGRTPDVRGTVDFVIKQWLKRNNRTSIHLVVTHLHSHLDHIWGDFQFQNRPNTTIVPPNSVPALQLFFGIYPWPTDIAQYNLGDRVLDIIPIPGHEVTHIAVYDRRTGVLLTGDTLYPGRLYINQPDHDIFEASVRRLVNFTKNKPVAHVLGTHIEQRRPYDDWPVGTHFVPEELPLELGRAQLLELLEASGPRSSQGKIIEKAYREFSTCGVYPTCNQVNK